MAVRQLVHHFGPDGNILSTIIWLAVILFAGMDMEGLVHDGWDGAVFLLGLK